MHIEVIRANYLNKQHQSDIIFLMNSYASDPMGGEKPLSDYVVQNLVVELSKLSYAYSVIAYIDGKPAGLTNCFEGFSTFYCKPLVNIHDMIVLKTYRGKGLSHRLLQKVEEIALQKGCCKLTLEVLSGNSVAKAAYEKFGFMPYELNPKMGAAMFWQKILD